MARTANMLCNAGALLRLFSLAALGACGAGSDARFPGRTLDAGTEADPSAGQDSGPPRAMFSMLGASTPAPFQLPWPNDLARTSQGTLDMRVFPNTGNLNVSRFIAAAGTLRGFSTQGAVYFRFSDALDSRTLPTLPRSRDRNASIRFVDVDPDSPGRGLHVPFIARFQSTATVFYPANTLAVRPVEGYPLRPSTTYAVIVTRKVTPLATGQFARGPELEEALSQVPTTDEAVAAIRNAYDPALAFLDSDGTPREDVLSMTVFTTQDPVAEMFALRDAVHAEVAAPTISGFSRPSDAAITSELVEVDGRIGPMPNFQAGEIPYLSSGGDLRFNAIGKPIIQGTFTTRVALTIPTSAMPADGFPIVLYAHGTGGDYRTFIREGLASWAAREGFAVVSIDQIHHGERNPTATSPDILYFNLLNPNAARNNNLQAAIDYVQLARAFSAGSTFEIPAALVPGASLPIRIDATRRIFVGHSQGAINGPLLLAADDGVSAGILSAGGGTIAITLAEKEDTRAIVGFALGLSGEPATAFAGEAFTAEHPVATLVQTWVDATDPANYAIHWFRTPRAGFAPKHVLQVMGTRDTATPPRTGMSLACAGGVPVVQPVLLEPSCLLLSELPSIGVPITANAGTSPRVTAGLIQAPGDHFVFFSALQPRGAHFLRTWAHGSAEIR